MNTNHLKKFAQSARRKLLSQVAAKLDYALTHDTAELREQATAIKKLKAELERIGKEQLVEKVSYIWFNRLMALRFMDANDYQPGSIRIVSARDGESLPEVLQEAKQGGLTDPAWRSKMSIVNDILDGKLKSKNPQNEAYRHLLVGACNQLSRQFPFLFERINDYAELLLPDDLTSEFSIVYDVVEGMSTEDCAEVEIIGWLYQFYISEKNETLIKSKKSYKKDELAPASQLFTPKWIVQYMVDNTLGQVWSEINPNTKVTSTLDYYIKPECIDKLEPREKKSIEEVKFFEPCVGSGHILSYAFDVFYKIYEEEGYNPAQIPELIITKNLYGVDIDERAAQLASFVLLMKGRQKSRRFIQKIETKEIRPNISFYQDFAFDDKFKNATAIGSLIKVEPSEIDNVKIDENSIFANQQRKLSQLYKFLGQRYDVVVTNPPYISSSRMSKDLKDFVRLHYFEGKTDLYSAFQLRVVDLVSPNGYFSQMTPFTWMYNSTFQKLRQKFLIEYSIHSLIQPEYHSFYDSAHVPICTYVIKKGKNNHKTTFINLDRFKDKAIQAPKALEAINNIECNWRYDFEADKLTNIPDQIMAFWIKEDLIKLFENNDLLDDHVTPCTGLQTGNNERFIRYWHEVSCDGINCNNGSPFTWVPLAKGGEFRRWYGNYNNVLKWSNNGIDLKNFKGSVIRNEQYYFKQGITWSRIGVGAFSTRLLPEGFVFDQAGDSMFVNEDIDIKEVLGYLNSKVASEIISALSSTMNLTAGSIGKVPYKVFRNHKLQNLVTACIEISKEDWNSLETSFEFSQSIIIDRNLYDIGEAINYYIIKSKNNIRKIFQNEYEINVIAIDALNLKDGIVDPRPNAELISINQKHVLSSKFSEAENKVILSFDIEKITFEFISYAVGCMMGRYSLDKEGLILANARDSLKQYAEIVGKSIADLTFEPDDDAIIPVLDDEWFEDDIVGRFYAFLKASFGERDFAKNLQYLEQQIGKDIRKYFVKDFYKDHIKRYKKRPIYWMFSSPKGHFRVLVYLHRYTPDTLNNILNDYLRDFIQKLEAQKQHYQQLQETGSASEQTKAIKEIDKLDKMLLDCQEYERDILYPLATERIAIDLDDGVLVNYNKFGKAVESVKGLNDAKAKKKVRGFDWIDVEEIRD